MLSALLKISRIQLRAPAISVGMAVACGFGAMTTAGADELLKSTFEDSLAPWTSSSSELYVVEDSHLKLIPPPNEANPAPLTAKFAMKPGTALTVSLDFQTVTDTRDDGHEFIMSLRDSASGEGYSITACAYPGQFGQPGEESGFAAGNYHKVDRAGEPGLALPALSREGFQAMVLTFDPATQDISLTQNGVRVLSFTGKQGLESVDTLELHLSSGEVGPARYVDNVVISGTPAKK